MTESDDRLPTDAATWWTVPEAAWYLQVSENAVYAAIRAGQMPVLHVGTQPRISPVALAEWTLERARAGLAGAAPAPEEAPAGAPTRALTAAPTRAVTDRIKPKHIGTAAWRRVPGQMGS